MLLGLAVITCRHCSHGFNVYNDDDVDKVIMLCC